MGPGTAAVELTESVEVKLLPHVFEANTETLPLWKPAGKVTETVATELSTVRGFPVAPRPFEMMAPEGADQRYEVAFANLLIWKVLVEPAQTPVEGGLLAVNVGPKINKPIEKDDLIALEPMQLFALTEINVARNPELNCTEIEFVPCPDKMVAFPKPAIVQV